MTQPGAIVVEGLVKRYGDKRAVDGLTLTVEAGETVALLGPNGAGKTTTIECCEGFRKPDGGSVRVLGFDPYVNRRQVRPLVGLMLQDGGVYPSAKPQEMLSLFSRFYKNPRDPHELLEQVGLKDHATTRFRDLSGGQKQRLSLALAVVGRPLVVFLDEPTAGLDPAARRLTWEFVQELKNDGVTIVLSTHLLDEAERLADRVAIIDHGRLITCDTPHALMGVQTAHVQFSAAPGLDVDAASTALGVDVHEDTPGRYVIAAENTPELFTRLGQFASAQNLTIEQYRAGSANLEDVFFRLTGQTNTEVNG